MKKALILSLCLGAVIIAQGQSLSYEYRYDNAGNRTTTTVVRLNSRDGFVKSESTDPLANMLGNGSAMMLYPNPAKDNIRFELTGDATIERYCMIDAAGRTLLQGICNDSMLHLDLTGLLAGMYFLELFIEGKPHVYKIIKQ